MKERGHVGYVGGESELAFIYILCLCFCNLFIMNEEEKHRT